MIYRAFGCLTLIDLRAVGRSVPVWIYRPRTTTTKHFEHRASFFPFRSVRFPLVHSFVVGCGPVCE
ncbi:unnamed protein product [Hapterophycus canaliculatus]